jgi:hypothetical protein
MRFLQVSEEDGIGANYTTEVNKRTSRLTPYRLISLGLDIDSQESSTGRRNLLLSADGCGSRVEVGAKVSQGFAPESDINTRIRSLPGLHTLKSVFSR